MQSANANAETSSGDAADDLAAGTSTPANYLNQSAAATDSAAKPGISVSELPQPTPQQLERWAAVSHEPLELLACRESESAEIVTELIPASDGKHYLLAGSRVSLWSLEAETPSHIFLDLDDDQLIKSMAVSPDGKWFAAGDSMGTLRIWNLENRELMVSKKLYASDVADIAISPDAKEIATISFDKEVTLWDASNLQERHRYTIPTNGLRRIAYATPETLFAAGESTFSLDVRSGKSQPVADAGRYAFTLARSPDGAKFVFGGREALQLWNPGDSTPIGRLAGGFSQDELARFSPDGKTLATANATSVRLWDVDSKRLLQMIEGYGASIVGLGWLPETNMLVVASQNSRVRIWGATNDAKQAGLSPLEDTQASAGKRSEAAATPAQLEQLIDLRTFPRMPEPQVLAEDQFSLNYTVATSTDEAKQFYRYQLLKAGWKEAAANPATPDSLRFEKQNTPLLVSLYTSDPSQLSVSVNLIAGTDLRKLPKGGTAAIQTVFENENAVIYRTDADLLDLETDLIRKLHESGWTAFAKLNASKNEPEDGRNLEFLRDAYTLLVAISKTPGQNGYTVQYSQSVSPRSIPVPRDSGFVEFDGSTQPYLVANTSMGLAETREFYDAEMVKQGWTPRNFGRKTNGEANWLPFIRGQREVTIGLRQSDAGGTLVRVGEGLEQTSWQLAKPPAEDSAAPTQSDAIEAADFPLLSSSAPATFSAEDKSIEFPIGSTSLLEIADRYTQEMQSRGWQLDGPGIKADDYVFLTFEKGKAEIQIRGRASGGSSSIQVSGEGLLWTKPLPGGKKVMSYEAWLRTNRHKASLDLLDDYLAEMKAIASK